MGGRNKLPLNIIELRGKKHLTKQEKETRKKSEIKMSDGKIKCPKYVRTNVEARRKWREVAPLLKNVDLLKPADVGSLARYCMTYSEYLDLLEERKNVSTIDGFTAKEEETICEEFEDKKGKLAAKKMWAKVEYMLSLNGKLTLDKAINQKLSVLLALEDHLFLNLLARTKNTVPKPPGKPQKSKDEQIYGE